MTQVEGFVLHPGALVPSSEHKTSHQESLRGQMLLLLVVRYSGHASYGPERTGSPQSTAFSGLFIVIRRDWGISPLSQGEFQALLLPRQGAQWRRFRAKSVHFQAAETSAEQPWLVDTGWVGIFQVRNIKKPHPSLGLPYHYSHPQIDGKVNHHQISRDLLFHLFGDDYIYHYTNQTWST